MKKEFLNINDKTAFVVGGDGLLGSDIVKQLKYYGSKVIVLDKTKKNYQKKQKNIFFEYFDLSKINLLNKKLDKIIKKHGCPNIFINAAYPRSKNWKNSTFSKLTSSELQLNVNIHLNSFIWSSMKIAEKMKKHKVKGSIILMNSIYGLVGQDKKLYKNTNIEMNPVYASIKGGLVTFVKSLSSYYGEENIRANSIIAGGIDGHIAGTKEKMSNSFKRKYKSKTLINRMGAPSDITSAILFLSSNSSSYITGTELYVDGGYSSL